MDLFTHLMFGFLLSGWESGGFYNTYVIFGCFAAILPDADVFFWPLGDKYPLLRHHGISHTLIFCLCASAILFGVAAAVFHIFDFRLFILMLGCSGMHVFSDYLTTWGVPALYPFSKKHYRVAVDLAVNPLVMLMFFALISFMQAAKLGMLGRVDIWMASYLTGIVYLAYFGGRAAAKAGLTLSAGRNGFSAIPTMSPFHWKTARREETEAEIRVTVRQRPGQADKVYLIPKRAVDKPQADEDFVAHSYRNPELHPWVAMWKFPYYEVERGQGGNVSVRWHTVEMPARFSSVVEYSPAGKVRVYDVFAPPGRRR